MKKEDLKRLKAGLLAGVLSLSLLSCKKESKKEVVFEQESEVAVIFIEGKALIYDGEYIFSSGVEAVLLKNKEDAFKLAEAIVGEENIIYMDYNDKDLELTYSKKIK